MPCYRSRKPATLAPGSCILQILTGNDSGDQCAETWAGKGTDDTGAKYDGIDAISNMGLVNIFMDEWGGKKKQNGCCADIKKNAFEQELSFFTDVNYMARIECH